MLSPGLYLNLDDFLLSLPDFFIGLGLLMRWSSRGFNSTAFAGAHQSANRHIYRKIKRAVIVFLLCVKEIGIMFFAFKPLDKFLLVKTQKIIKIRSK